MFYEGTPRLSRGYQYGCPAGIEERLLAPRNVMRPRPARQECERALVEVGMPSIAEPETFVDRLVGLELRLGTWRTLSVGMLAIAETTNIRDVSGALDRLDDMLDALPQSARESVKGLYEFLGPRLTFLKDQNSFSVALPALGENYQAEDTSPGEMQLVGNCVVDAALFAVFSMALGWRVTEIKLKGNVVHDYVGVTSLTGTWVFDRVSNKPRFETLADWVSYRRDSSPFETGNFGFITSALLADVELVIERLGLGRITLSGPRQDFSPEERAQIILTANRLRCAEAVNYLACNWNIYWQKLEDTGAL